MSQTWMGNQFGKPDIERLGLFSDLGYMNGKGYFSASEQLGSVMLYNWTERSYFKGANFLGTGRKIKDGTQHGYFDDQFRRLFIGEGIVRKKSKPEKIKIPFILNFVPKKHSTPGDTFGTFTKKTVAFSPKAYPRIYVREPPNMIGRSGKIGGPGYANSGINKYPIHSADRYGAKPKYKQYGEILNGPYITASYPEPYFEKGSPYAEKPIPSVGLYLNRNKKKKVEILTPWIPNCPSKWQGGSHQGGFEKWPEWRPCKYVSMDRANKPTIGDKVRGAAFMPAFQVPKTQYTNSIMNQSVDVFMNTSNAQTYVPCYIEHLISDIYE